MEDFVDLLKTSSAGLSLGAIVTVGLLAIFSGGLVPSKSHNREIRLLENQIDLLTKEKDDWKDAHNAKDAEVAELRNQVSVLVDSTRTTTALIESLRSLIDRRGE